MSEIRLGNAPCSWGSLEFEGLEGEEIGYSRMLDELAETGYTGTELGDWGYMPTNPAALTAELESRRLTMLGAFVPVAFRHGEAHAAGIEHALRVARLLSKAGDPVHRPFLVLADDNGSDPVRSQHAGRITPEMGLSDAEWDVFAEGVEETARAVMHDTGLRCVFHHHCAGFVETPGEIDRLLSLTDPEVVGLVFDTGHYAYAAGSCDVVSGLERFRDRIWYMHFKDCEPDVARRARDGGWDYFTALRNGIFCELGRGCVDFQAVHAWLRNNGYNGWAVVEQDVLPGMGAPAESARRNREYLRSIGL